jgi:hypothetical protein
LRQILVRKSGGSWLFNAAVGAVPGGQGDQVTPFWIFDGSTLLTTGFGFWIKGAKTEKQKALGNGQREINLPDA